MIIGFSEVMDFEGWGKFPSFIEELITTHSLRRICEVGAGANPAVSPDFTIQHGLQYSAMDNSEAEVGKSGLDQMALVDICAAEGALPGAPYDLICSRMSAEHFENSTNAYVNMFQSLAPGGLCVHSFATLYTLPFLLNRILPDSLSDFILHCVQPSRDREKHDKFKAHYHHCRGPIKSQILFFQDIGYEILECRGYFGHDYYSVLPPLHFMEKKKTQLLLKAPIAYLTSYSTIILRRPLNS